MLECTIKLDKRLVERVGIEDKKEKGALAVVIIDVERISLGFTGLNVR